MIRASPPTPDKNNVPAAHVTITAIQLPGFDKENTANKYTTFDTNITKVLFREGHDYKSVVWRRFLMQHEKMQIDNDLIVMN